MAAVISIITPSFNRADIIHETAQSIFNQTYPHWEWVITDDGSTDNSWELLQQYAANDNRIKIYRRNREPKGACVCRNISVENCTGEYVLFLDTDDLLSSFCLQQRVSTMQQYPDNDFVIFPMLLFKHKPDDLKLLWNIDSPQNDIERILIGNPVCQGTGPLWKKSSFISSGMWNEQLLLWQDIELHLRSLLMGMKYIKRMDLEPDIFLRISDVSLSRTGYHSLPKFQSRLQVLQQTTEQIINKEMLPNYRNGLRSMFIDLFINAVNSNYHNEIRQMMELQIKWKLLKSNEQRVCNLYASMFNYKLYKLPFLQKFFLKQLKQFTESADITLGCITYTNTVKT
jgi:glycosyltransferase involved in cell wall biosynthesis